MFVHPTVAVNQTDPCNAVQTLEAVGEHKTRGSVYNQCPWGFWGHNMQIIETGTVQENYNKTQCTYRSDYWVWELNESHFVCIHAAYPYELVGKGTGVNVLTFRSDSGHLEFLVLVRPASSSWNGKAFGLI